MSTNSDFFRNLITILEAPQEQPPTKRADPAVSDANISAPEMQKRLGTFDKSDMIQQPPGQMNQIAPAPQTKPAAPQTTAPGQISGPKTDTPQKTAPSKSDPVEVTINGTKYQMFLNNDGYYYIPGENVPRDQSGKNVYRPGERMPIEGPKTAPFPRGYQGTSNPSAADPNMRTTEYRPDRDGGSIETRTGEFRTDRDGGPTQMQNVQGGELPKPVPPRPVNPQQARQWTRQYFQTHNPDGTPKIRESAELTAMLRIAGLR